MFFGAGHVAAMVASLRTNKRKRPNMRIEFDYKSRRGIRNFRFRQNKKLSAQQISQLRFAVEQNRKHRLRNQIIVLIISIVLLGLLIWGFLLVFNWFAAQPSDIYNPNA